LIQELSTNGVEWQTLTPDRGRGPLVNTLDESTEDTSVAIGASQGQQDAVGVPGNTRDGAAERLFEVLGHPPVVLLFKVADSCNTSTATHGKLCLIGRPSHTSSGSVDAEEDEGGAPGAVRGLPHIGVAVLRTGHNLARIGSNIDTGNELVVAAQLVVESKGFAVGRVQLDGIVSGDSECLAIGREGVVGDWVVEEVVNLRGGGHDEGSKRQESSLLPVWMGCG
jgi:hypothetical protein